MAITPGAFETLRRVLVALDRSRAGRDPLPTAAVVSAQAVRSGTVGVAGQRGYDTAWRVIGRERHALVDADERLLGVCMSPASSNSNGGIGMRHASREYWLDFERCLAHSAYAGKGVAGATAIAVTIVRAKPGQKYLAAQPRRWIVERSFAHARRCRRTGAGPLGNPGISLWLLRPSQCHAARQATGTGDVNRFLWNYA